MTADPNATAAGRAVNQILEDHGLPEKLIPDNVTRFEFDQGSGRFRVELDGVVKERFGGIKVVYQTVLTGTLKPGRITDLNGAKAKIGLSLAIRTIEDQGDQLEFGLGRISKRLPRSIFV